MKFKLFGIPVWVSYPAVAFFAVAIICDNEGLFLLCMLSSFCHELGHIVLMRMFKVGLMSISFNLGDVSIKRAEVFTTFLQDVLITMGGIVVNLILSLLFFILYKICGFSFCLDFSASNLCVALFNLLPMKSLDGGNLLYMLLKVKLSDINADRILNLLTALFLVPLGAISFLTLFSSGFNYSFLIVAVFLVCTLVQRSY